MQYSKNVVTFFTLMIDHPEQAASFRANRTLFLNHNYPPGDEWPTLSDTDKQDIMNLSFEDVNRWNYTFSGTAAVANGSAISQEKIAALHGNGIPFMNQVDLIVDIVSETEIRVMVDAHEPANPNDEDATNLRADTSVVHIVGVISSSDGQPLIHENGNLIIIPPQSSVTFDTNNPHYQNRTHVKATGYIKPGNANDGVISLVFTLSGRPVEGGGRLVPEFSLNPGAWFAVLAFFVLAEVFREGARLRDEQKYTI